MLTPFLSEYGKMSVLPARMLVTIEDAPDFLARFDRLIRDIDHRPRQILIEAKILEITLTSEDSYGVDWTDLFRSGESSGTFGTRGLGEAGAAGPVTTGGVTAGTLLWIAIAINGALFVLSRGLGAGVIKLEPQRKMFANTFRGEPFDCVGGTPNDLTADARGGHEEAADGAKHGPGHQRTTRLLSIPVAQTPSIWKVEPTAGATQTSPVICLAAKSHRRIRQ